MTDEAFNRAVADFLAVVPEEDEPSGGRLAAVVDGLAAAYHHTPLGRPASDGREAPDGDHDVLRRLVGTRFPGLGLYAITPDPSDPTPRMTEVGDALDDLVDIVRDLRTFSWRMRTTGREDAYWHLRLSFETHWGTAPAPPGPRPPRAKASRAAGRSGVPRDLA